MQPFRADRFSVILLVLLLSISGATSRCGLKCSSKVKHKSTELYALKLSQSLHNTSINVTVKVYMTKCPGIDTPGPSWYKLEARSDESQLEGKFEEPHTLTEAYTSSNKAVVEFSTSEPFAITDLPRTYSWSRHRGNVGKICFRLTVLANDSESDKCRQTEKCIWPEGGMDADDTESTGDSQEKDDNQISTGDTEETASPNTTKQRCQYNCTTAKQGAFCAYPPDGKVYVYSSRCEWRKQKCLLRARGVNVEDMEVLKCPKTTPMPSSEPTSSPESTRCWNLREELVRFNLTDWIPKCNCRGGYKLIQCETHDGSARCWCQTQYGDINGPKLDLQCTDPETYNLYSPCLL